MNGRLPKAGEIGECRCCGRIVLAIPIGTGSLGLVEVIDPDFRQRRWVRSIVGPAYCMRQGFGPGYGTSHACFAGLSRVEVLGLYGGDQLLN